MSDAETAVKNESFGATVRAVEALLFLTAEPVSVQRLAAAIGVDQATVQEALSAVAERFRADRSGIVLRELAGGYCLASSPEAHTAAVELLGRGSPPALTAAQTETLAIVAYLQPVSRPEIARIRGVSAETATTVPQERGLIEEAGRSEYGAALYRTSSTFLKQFGLKSLDALPPLEGFTPSPQERQRLTERLLQLRSEEV